MNSRHHILAKERAKRVKKVMKAKKLMKGKKGEKVLIDPINVIPKEIFTHLFRILPLSSMATASEVSRNWRQTLLSDPTLYYEVDTSRFGFRDQHDVLPLLYHLNRWTYLSRNNLRRIHLHIDPFLDAYLDRDIPKKKGSVTALDSLLLALSTSRESLREISIRANRGPQDEEAGTEDGEADSADSQFKAGMPSWSYPINNLLSFLLLLLDGLSSFPALNKIEIEVPIPLTFKIGGDDPNGKFISIQDNDPDPDTVLNEPWEDYRQMQRELSIDSFGSFDSFMEEPAEEVLIKPVQRLMRSAIKFAGDRFEEFTLPRPFSDLSFSDRMEILKMLLPSSQTLQTLEFSSDFNITDDDSVVLLRKLFALSKRSPKLTSFCALESFEASREFHPVTTPDSESASTPRNTRYAFFEIQATMFEPEILSSERNSILDTEREYWSNWGGNPLEELEIVLHEYVSFPRFIGDILLNSVDCLKSLTIAFPSTAGQDGERAEVFNHPLTFPKLESLGFNGATTLFSSFLSESGFPKLQELIIDAVTQVRPQVCFNCALMLLEKYSQNLTELHLDLDFSDQDPFVQPPSNLKLQFPKLESLRIKSNGSGLRDWIKQFSFPALIHRGIYVRGRDGTWYES